MHTIVDIGFPVSLFEDATDPVVDPVMSYAKNPLITPLGSLLLPLVDKIESNPGVIPENPLLGPPSLPFRISPFLLVCAKDSGTDTIKESTIHWNPSMEFLGNKVANKICNMRTSNQCP